MKQYLKYADVIRQPKGKTQAKWMSPFSATKYPSRDITTRSMVRGQASLNSSVCLSNNLTNMKHSGVEKRRIRAKIEKSLITGCCLCLLAVGAERSLNHF
ncbi:MAG: hypothetical protein ABJ004_04525 [Cyclobacteriaceae bacterium]